MASTRALPQAEPYADRAGIKTNSALIDINC
jgi:hypothetical protein